MAGVPNGVRTVDAFLSTLTVEHTDGAGLQPSQAKSRSQLATLLPGEMAMAVDFIEMALEAAALKYDCTERRDARAWLLDHSSIYSARVCFEAIMAAAGYEPDFDRVCKELTRTWISQVASESPEEGHA